MAPSPRELPAKRGEGELTLGSPAAFAADSVWRGFRAKQSNTPSVSRQKTGGRHLPQRGRQKGKSKAKPLLTFDKGNDKSQFISFPLSKVNRNLSFSTLNLSHRLPLFCRSGLRAGVQRPQSCFTICGKNKSQDARCRVKPGMTNHSHLQPLQWLFSFPIQRKIGV